MGKNIQVPIIAFSRRGSLVYESLKDCCMDYGIRSKETLRRLIDCGGVGPDGYTTFDYLVEENEVKKNCV